MNSLSPSSLYQPIFSRSQDKSDPVERAGAVPKLVGPTPPPALGPRPSVRSVARPSIRRFSSMPMHGRPAAERERRRQSGVEWRLPPSSRRLYIRSWLISLSTSGRKEEREKRGRRARFVSREGGGGGGSRLSASATPPARTEERVTAGRRYMYM